MNYSDGVGENRIVSTSSLARSSRVAQRCLPPANLRYSDLDEAADGCGGRYGISIGSYWNDRYLRDESRIAVCRFIHEAKNNDGLMLTRNRPLFNALISPLVSNLRCALHHTRASVRRAAALSCTGHAQQLGGVSPSTQPDGGEGLAKRKGYRREAGSRRSVKQTCESMDKNRV